MLRGRDNEKAIKQSLNTCSTLEKASEIELSLLPFDIILCLKPYVINIWCTAMQMGLNNLLCIGT